MLKRVGQNRWVVMSADGKKKLSKPMTHGAAVNRLKQVEHYKNVKSSSTGSY